MIAMTDPRYVFVMEKHAGQKDKAGEDYFSAHLVPVALSVPSHLFYVALAHDILEDTDTTMDELRDAGFSDEDANTIRVLTRYPNESLETYIGFVRRVEHARIVKTADIVNNLSRVGNLDRKNADRLKRKYLRTLLLLQGIDIPNHVGPSALEQLMEQGKF